MSFLRINLAVLAFCCPVACLADTRIYAFVDDQGGMYLSNVPDDGRYRVLIGPIDSSSETAREAPLSPARQAPLRPDDRQQYGAVVEQTAVRFGIDPALLRAVISVESGYDPNAISRRGAGGLMQLMPETAKRYGVTNVFDPVDNVRGGARYLAELLKTFENDLQLALAAYNAGEAAVLKYGKRVPPYRETVAYVAKVVDSYHKYRSPI
jgi:soluble lytic murein transglycosylase-like protein